MKTKIPAAPRHFSERARRLWKSVQDEFELSAESVELLRVSLEHMDLADQAREALRRDGLLLTGPRGAQRVSPLVSAASQHDTCFMRGLKQLGLDIAAPDEKAGRRS